MAAAAQQQEEVGAEVVEEVEEEGGEETTARRSIEMDIRAMTALAKRSNRKDDYPPRECPLLSLLSSPLVTSRYYRPPFSALVLCRDYMAPVVSRKLHRLLIAAEFSKRSFGRGFFVETIFP